MENQQVNKYELIHLHYYGQTVRTLFLIAGLIMIFTYPFFSDMVPVPTYLSICIMVLLVIFGGLINPVQRWLLVLSNIIPVVGLIVTEYQATYSYSHLSVVDGRAPVFFWTNQILSFIFFVAIYLSVKTARGRFVEEVR